MEFSSSFDRITNKAGKKISILAFGCSKNLDHDKNWFIHPCLIQYWEPSSKIPSVRVSNFNFLVADKKMEFFPGISWWTSSARPEVWWPTLRPSRPLWTRPRQIVRICAKDTSGHWLKPKFLKPKLFKVNKKYNVCQGLWPSLFWHIKNLNNTPYCFWCYLFPY